MQKRALILSGLLAAALLGSEAAEAMRCGNRIIARGDHSTKMLRFCGEPAAVQSRVAQRTFVGKSGTVVLPGFVAEVWIEEWTYNFGPYKLMRQVRVEDGIVAEIRHLGYGFSP